MKLFEIPMVVMSLFGLCVFTGLDAPVAQAGFVFGPATNLGPTVNSSAFDMFPVLSPDGLELYLTSTRSGGLGDGDIWVAKRASVYDPWGAPTNLGPNVNTSTWESAWSMSADGLTLYLDSGGGSKGRPYQTTRATREAPWQPRVDLGPAIGAGSGEEIISPDGLELYFIAWSWAGGYGGWDTWVSTRATVSAPWGTPVNLGPTINTPHDDCPTWISPDGLTLLLASNRPGGFGNFDVWMTTRLSKGSPWGPPKNLGPSINTMYTDEIVSISADGRWCYLDDLLGPRPGGCGGADIWQAPILPIVDFNGDGKVDLDDLRLLIDIDNWDSDNTLYDIGPYAWGDGKVGIEDLKVFIAEWEKAMEAEEAESEAAE